MDNNAVGADDDFYSVKRKRLSKPYDAEMKYKTVLFDFDGTLSPTLDYWFNSFRRALAKLGIQATDDDIFEKCFYKNDSEIGPAFGFESCAEFWRHTFEALNEEFATAELFGGVDEVLEHCERTGISVGLVTSGERAIVEPALHKFGIHHHFNATITANETTNYKPHPEPVLKALTALKADPTSTLFVGDHIVDVIAGKSAGTDTAIYFTESHGRFHKLDELKTSEPTFVFSDYRDLVIKLS